MAEKDSRPPYSYASLVAQALHAKGKASLQEIYTWISESYPFYSLEDQSWKASPFVSFGSP